MAKVVVFGVKDYSELANYYLENDSEHQVVAFSVHSDYMPAETTFHGRPIAPFEEIERHYPPGDHQFFAPMSPRNMNRDRQAVYDAIKTKGYTCISYVSSKATLFDNEIGENCFILEDNTLQPFTSIGHNVVLWSGNHIGHHGAIRDHVTLTSHVVVSGHCEISEFCFLGVNSTLADGIRLAEGTFVQMAAAIAKHTEAWGVYRGNPAEKLAMPSTKIKF